MVQSVRLKTLSVNSRSQHKLSMKTPQNRPCSPWIRCTTTSAKSSSVQRKQGWRPVSTENWAKLLPEAMLQTIIRFRVITAIHWLEQRSPPAFHFGKAFGVNFLLDVMHTNPCWWRYWIQAKGPVCQQQTASFSACIKTPAPEGELGRKQQS